MAQGRNYIYIYIYIYIGLARHGAGGDDDGAGGAGSVAGINMQIHSQMGIPFVFPGNQVKRTHSIVREHIL